jgi:hypothetical protein
MLQTDYPPWPDAKSALTDGARISPEQLSRLGGGDQQTGYRQLRAIIAAETERKVSRGPTARPASVRFAGPEDEDAILARLLEDVAENASHIGEPSADQIMKHIRAGTRRNGGVVGVIDGDDGKPAAVCILIPAQWWWSEDWYLWEIANYVHPDYRQTRHIDDLLNFERWLSDEWSVQYGHRVYLLTGVMATKRLRSKVLLFWQRLTEVGRAYIYPPPPGIEL